MGKRSTKRLQWREEGSFLLQREREREVLAVKLVLFSTNSYYFHLKKKKENKH
jgi:hypothetical protein